MTSDQAAAAPDPYALWDAAYVLGALAPAERREYEQHLAGCPACQRAVAELAGLPGLLAQVPLADAAALDAEIEHLEAPPVSLRPALLARARVGRHRRALGLAAVAAALVVIAGAGGAAIGREVFPIASRQTYRVAFSPVEPSAITAVVDVTPGWRQTELAVECQYATPTGPDRSGAYADYAIWVTDRAGNAKELKRWAAKPGKQMRPKASTEQGTWWLAEVEIRDVASGRILLRAPLR